MKIKKILIMGTLALCGVVALPFILTACNNSSTNQESKPNQPKPPVDNGGSETPKPPLEPSIKNTIYEWDRQVSWVFVKNKMDIVTNWSFREVQDDFETQIDKVKNYYIQNWVWGPHLLNNNTLRFVTSNIIKNVNMNKYELVLFFVAENGTIYKDDKLNVDPINLKVAITLPAQN